MGHYFLIFYTSIYKKCMFFKEIKNKSVIFPKILSYICKKNQNIL